MVEEALHPTGNKNLMASKIVLKKVFKAQFSKFQDWIYYPSTS